MLRLHGHEGITNRDVGRRSHGKSDGNQEKIVGNIREICYGHVVRILLMCNKISPHNYYFYHFQKKRRAAIEQGNIMKKLKNKTL